ncbi:T9SS type A sorting domain-containing protein [Pelobium sp.]|nr:two-component regulator propeller domain-containing protein [Pelobium sp.]MDA9555568.1 T9SS type A sorting domain-containing protein [Pelobium sp.]
MKKISLFLLILFYGSLVLAQQVPIGNWRTHLPYNSVVAVAASDQEIYCGTQGGIFTINKSNGEIKKLSTIDGLVDINVSTLAWNATTKQLMVAYENANIDLISDDKIYHLPEIFNKTGLGNKRINAISFKDEFAYLSCGFGIVVYDLKKREVKDTYFIGNGGTNLEIYNIAIQNQDIFAATAYGIYQASLNNPLLADYKSWTKHSNTQNYPGGINQSIVSFNGFIYGLFTSGIYKFKDSSWQLTSLFRPDVKGLNVSENNLLSISSFRVISYNSSENIIKNIQNLSGFSQANQAIIGQNQELLIADNLKGLVKTTDGNSFNYILPNGPNTASVKALNFIDNKIFLSPGAITDTYAPGFNNDGFSVFENESWQSFNNLNVSALSSVRDIVTTVEEPASKKKYLGSYVNGLIEFNADQSVKIYNQNNSSLQATIGDPTTIRVNGVALDKGQNVWVSQYGVSKPLSVKSLSGQWTAYGFPDVLINPFTEVSGLIIDKNNNKWLKLRNDGLLVFDGNKAKKFGFTANNGALPGTNVNVLTVDRDGAVWVGTNRGVAVFSDIDNIFSNVNAEIPNVVEGGFLKPLLGTENVNYIAVDGANRKWIGTDNGLWLFNADGTKQILFFNKNNSPLLSNRVISIAIDDQSGEVFIGTAAGIISYKGDATAPVVKMDKITVYPNPVRPGYNGTIGIKGLSENAQVKITDINGVLVYQTQSNGGQATWDGKNFNREAASSGVYLVLIVNKDGTDSAVAKILIVR